MINIFKPIWIGEGERVPNWYGFCRYVPFEITSKHNIPEVHRRTFEWRKMAMVIPINVLVTWYWRLKRYLICDAMLPPEFYQNRMFQIYEDCPECGAPLCRMKK